MSISIVTLAVCAGDKIDKTRDEIDKTRDEIDKTHDKIDT